VELDVNALVGRLLLLTGGALGDRGVYVERELAPDLPQVRARADQITQVLLNLVMNAADAMPDGGTITIRTRQVEPEPADARVHPLDAEASEFTASEVGLAEPPQPPAQVVIEVEDTGSGVPLELRSRIFDPFFTTKPEGSGLGLAICRQIIADHDGWVDVGGEPGCGAVFTIVLPADESPVAVCEEVL
jgi:signal transduction histidine kinase